MKKTILFLSLILISFACKAQTDLPTDTVEYRATLADAQFVAGTVSADATVVDAITWASEGVTNPNTVITIVITESELVQVAKSNSLLPEGVAAAINARLFAAVQRLLPSRPWLAQQLGQLLANNDNTVSNCITRGRNIILAKIAASNRQR